MIHIQEAMTDELRMSAYRLRHEVFSREMGDHRYADHERQIWTDCDDGPQSKVIVVINDENEVVGTIRHTRLNDWEIIGKDAYGLTILAEILGLNVKDLESRSSRIDRAAIAMNWRGKSIVRHLQEACERLAKSLGSDILIGIPGIENARSRKAYEKLGWLEYPVVGTHGGFTAQMIYKDLRKP